MQSSPYLGAPVRLHTGDRGQICNAELVARRQHIEPGIIAVGPGMWSVVGLSVAISHVLEAPEGLIVIDSGGGNAHGAAIRELIGQISQRPIAALMYTHSHYVHGSEALLAEATPPIYGHYLLEQNLSRAKSHEGVAYRHRLLAQFGRPLPTEGPDADPIATAQRPAGASGYRPVTRPCAVHGEELVIAGEPAQIFTDFSFDTDDSLIIFFPRLATAVHNHLTASFPNIVSVAGGGYRDPLPWLAGLDLMLRLRPERLLGVHGLPLVDAATVQDHLSAFRDALQFSYDQAVRGMNRGLSADELLTELSLPAELASHPAVSQNYSEWQFGIRGIYAGLLGWYSGDAVDLHPVPLQLESERIVSGFGGLEACLEAVEHELAEQVYAWAAKLARHCTRVAPPGSAAYQRACQLLASALQAMGQAAPAWTTRNVYLTQAGEWAGRWDRAALPPEQSAASALASPPGTWVRALGFRVDPTRPTPEADRCSLAFSDTTPETACTLQLRRGVGICTSGFDAEACLRLRCRRLDFLRFFFAEFSWAELAASAAQCQPAATDPAWAAFWACFDAWPPQIRRRRQHADV